MIKIYFIILHVFNLYFAELLAELNILINKENSIEYNKE